MRGFLATLLFAMGCPSAKVEDQSIRKAPDPVVATSSAAIEYRLSFAERHAHYVAVEATFPADERKELILTMPVWTPGSYLVREFSRNVHDLEARSAKGPLAAAKIQKNRWRILLDGSPYASIRYRVYARQANVRDDFVDRDFAVLNGAPTFFADADHLHRPYRVKLELPPEWKTSVSALRSSGPNDFLAESYDVLVDSPIVAGNPAIHRFEVDGVEHLLVNTDEGTAWDGPRSAQDTEAIARSVARFWGVLPYNRYLFFNVQNDARGGLEHKNSTVLMTSRWRTRDEEEYRTWLSTVCHEHFHAWNGKRLRPQVLGPFDYEREVYTSDLWIVEGLTTYYDDLLLARAGLVDEQEYLTSLSKQIEALQLAPGRKHDSLASSSYDAWIEFYRWDENGNNVWISYYTKGAVVGFLIDAAIRRATNDGSSLDDVMRLAYQRYSGERGYTTDDFYRIVEEIGGAAVRERLRLMVETTEELEYGPALDWYGLEIEPPEVDHPKAWAGLKTAKEGGRIVVTEVVEGTPAYDARINFGDEIIAIDGYRVDDLAAHTARYKPKDQVKVLVARRGVLTELALTMAEAPGDLWKIRLEKMRSATQIQRFKRLVGVR